MCYNPVLKRTNKFTGDKQFVNVRKMLKTEKLTECDRWEIQLLPCRQCLECRQARANEWAMRCMFEMQEHLHNCFITLTYAPTSPRTGLPAPIHLVRKDYKQFKYRLRKAIKPHKIKTFDCGEYGDIGMRPHFHAIIFGYDFPDKFKIGQSSKGFPTYTSESLEKLWGHGLVTVQDVTMATCAYTAMYSAKPKKDLPNHLKEYPEYNTMSKNLGIEPLMKIMGTALKTDEIFVDGRAHRIPQTLLNKVFGTTGQRRTDEEYQALKANRIAKAERATNSFMSYFDDDYHAMIDEKKRRKEKMKKQLLKKL